MRRARALFPDPTGPVTATGRRPEFEFSLGERGRRGAGIAEGDVAHEPAQRARELRPAVGPPDARYRPRGPRRNEAQRRLARDGQRGGQQRPQPRVGGGAALDGVDELGDAKAAVDEAQIELEVGDERAHRHRARDHPLAPLPHQSTTPLVMSVAVDRLEPALQPDALRLARRTAGESAATRSTEALARAEQAQHPRRRPAAPAAPTSGRRSPRGRAVVRSATQRPVAWASSIASGHAAAAPGGQAGVDHEHRHDERDREQDGVPGLDRELAHADAEHLDVAHDARHQVAERRPLESAMARPARRGRRRPADWRGSGRWRSSATSASHARALR